MAARTAWDSLCLGILNFEVDGKLRGNWQSLHPAQAKMAFCPLKQPCKIVWWLSTGYLLSCTKGTSGLGVEAAVGGSTGAPGGLAIQCRAVKEPGDHHCQARQRLRLLLIPLISI